MKKSLVLFVVIVGMAMASLAIARSITGDAIGHARQHQINGSGIQGHIFVVDNGSNLVVVGAATGMDHEKLLFTVLRQPLCSGGA